MNELPSSTQPTAPSSQPGEAAQQAPASQSVPPVRSSNIVVYLVLLLLACGIAAVWWTMQSEISALRQEVSRRLHDSDNVTSETRLTARSVQEGMKELQAKLNVLENKQIEAQSQWLALEQLYQDLTKTREDWVLAEIEQVLSTATQQLQLAGNVSGAIIALQNADARLSRLDNTQFVQIRRAIAKDLETLKSLPAVDFTGIALRLDSLIGRIDSMPLLSAEKPPEQIAEPRTQRFAAQQDGQSDNANAGTPQDWLAWLEQKWTSITHEIWAEVRQLVQVRKVNVPEALLLSPTEAYYARENLKLRLLNARLALLTRNEEAFRSDLVAAQEIIVKYFDTRAKQTQTVQELLKQIQGSNLSIDMPTLADSLNAVRTYRTRSQ